MNNIDTYLSALPEWQKDNLELFRTIVHKVEPLIVEDWKWNVPVFMYADKVQFAMSAFKAHTKYNFMRNGALIEDKDSLFNNGLESKASRGIDMREGESIDEKALTILIKKSIDYSR